MTAPVKPKRLMVYIDGFSLYFGMRAAKLQRYYWLDIWKMAETITPPGCSLVECKYFTARIASELKHDTPDEAVDRKAKRLRQNSYLDALTACNTLQVFEGRYQSMPKKCRHCNGTYYRHEEKITDVGIATEMLTDAFSDSFDVATLVSADSDLVPVVKRVRGRFPAKDVLVAFPPKRGCKELKQTATNSFHLSRDLFAKCQFPNLVPTPRGFAVVRPPEWA